MDEEISGREYLAQFEAVLREEGDRFYAALGRAITSWNYVETALYKLFLLCMGLPDEETASVAYHAVVNFNARLKMVNSAFALRFGETAFNTRWSALHKSLEGKAKLRNELAHFYVAEHQRGEPGRKWYLVPNLNDVSKHPRVSKKPLTRIFTSDLDGRQSAFRDLAAELQDLATDIHLKQRTGRFAGT